MGNSMNYSPKPVLDCYSQEGFGRNFSYGSAIMQGWRRNQEDRYICLTDFYKEFSFFGVYDGHGGFEVAEYLKRKLHLYIQEFLQSSDDVELALYLGFLSCDESIKDAETQAELNEILKSEKPKLGLMEMLHKNSPEAFHTKSPLPPRNPLLYASAGPSTGHRSKSSNDEKSHGDQKQISNSDQDDEEMPSEIPLGVLLKEDLETSDSQDSDFSDEQSENDSSGDESEEDENSSSGSEDDRPGFTPEDLMSAEPGDLSGSTATVVVTTKTKIYVANVGDSRCILSRKGVAIDLSLDHKPEDPEERARVIASGATVSEDGRVNDCLNLSRAFGDFKFKNGTSIPIDQSITVEPYIKAFDITEDDEFLLVASDGIWNSMNSQEVVDFVNIRLKSTKNYSEVCDDLFRLIIAPDKDNDGTGCDNMSCILLKLGEKNAMYFSNESSANEKNASNANSTEVVEK